MNSQKFKPWQHPQSLLYLTFAAIGLTIAIAGNTEIIRAQNIQSNKFNSTTLLLTARTEEEQQRIDLYKQVNPAVVTVYANYFQGSGFIISKEGLVITSYHVIAGSIDTVNIIFADGSWEKGDIIYPDINADLAAIKIRDRSNLPFLKLAEKN